VEKKDLGFRVQDFVDMEIASHEFKIKIL